MAPYSPTWRLNRYNWILSWGPRTHRSWKLDEFELTAENHSVDIVGWIEFADLTLEEQRAEADWFDKEALLSPDVQTLCRYCREQGFSDQVTRKVLDKFEIMEKAYETRRLAAAFDHPSHSLFEERFKRACFDFDSVCQSAQAELASPPRYFFVSYDGMDAPTKRPPHPSRRTGSTPPATAPVLDMVVCYPVLENASEAPGISAIQDISKAVDKYLNSGSYIQDE